MAFKAFAFHRLKKRGKKLPMRRAMAAMATMMRARRRCFCRNMVLIVLAEMVFANNERWCL